MEGRCRFGLSLLPALLLLTIGLSTFMSNTAAANLLLPIGISSAALLGGNGGPATQAAVSIALAASLSMTLPVSTPPNAIAYAAGGFATRDLRRVGLLVGAAGALFVVLGGGFVLRQWGDDPMTAHSALPLLTLSAQDYDGVLFDLDGVLTKAASVHAPAWKKLFDQFLINGAPILLTKLSLTIE